MQHADAENITGRRPDYTFRIDQKPRFYVEAKKPSEDLERNKKHAFQVRSYGWNTRLPISVLTDFQELAVYDCRLPPNEQDLYNKDVAEARQALDEKTFSIAWAQGRSLTVEQAIAYV